MKKNRIFLSYRRDDSPGYVSRLEEELERVFGVGTVFRDVTDIPGGTQWKNVIDANLHSSAVLILIIGPRWERIWHERVNDEVNHVALELQRAHELDVPIIPVTLDGTRLSRGLDLGSISFILDNQFHDISDRQGRWRGDFEQLVSLLASVPGMGPVRTDSTAPAQPLETDGKSRFKWLAAAALLLIVATLWFTTSVEVEEPIANQAPHTPAGEPIALTDDTSTLPPQGNVQSTGPVDVPDINGTWVGQDDTVYLVRQDNDGTFNVESPGNASGQGRFFGNMPRKFEIEMVGTGRGEFSVSASGDRAMGWFIIDGQQKFDTLTRVE